MYLVLGYITHIAGIAGLVLMALIARKKIHYDILKKEGARIIIGRKENCTELPAYRPPGYLVEVEYEIDNESHRQKILIFDNRIKDVPFYGQIKLFYVEKTNKIYWADDKSLSDMSFHIIILTIFTGLMMMASVVCFVKGM